MKSILYIIAAVMLAAWLIGVLVYSIAGLINILLVLAAIALLLQLTRKPKNP